MWSKIDEIKIAQYLILIKAEKIIIDEVPQKYKEEILIRAVN